MADYSSVAPPSSNAGGGMNDAFKDALQRARQVVDEQFAVVSKCLFYLVRIDSWWFRSYRWCHDGLSYVNVNRC